PTWGSTSPPASRSSTTWTRRPCARSPPAAPTSTRTPPARPPRRSPTRAAEMRGREASDGSVDRWARGDWWGVVLDAPDAPALARFYSALLGWEIAHEGEGYCTLGPKDG